MPLTPLPPVHAPLAVQEAAVLEDQVSCALWPRSIAVGATVSVTPGAGGLDDWLQACCAGGMFQFLLPKVSRLLQLVWPGAPGPWFSEPKVPLVGLSEAHCESPLHAKW
ncbi:MAG TPA: hypothetical protein VM240_09530 [Verrucomicrobiae bacterium]|nr:hypothetical protein [Verrucomicrobiae bacterium]